MVNISSHLIFWFGHFTLPQFYWNLLIPWNFPNKQIRWFFLTNMDSCCIVHWGKVKNVTFLMSFPLLLFLRFSFLTVQRLFRWHPTPYMFSCSSWTCSSPLRCAQWWTSQSTWWWPSTCSFIFYLFKMDHQTFSQTICHVISNYVWCLYKVDILIIRDYTIYMFKSGFIPKTT